MNQVELVRPFGIDTDYHKKKWQDLNVTVLICQRKTRDLIELSLNSLFRFYPDIPVLVVDGDSQDDSAVYLKQMQKQYSNLRVWTRPSPKEGITSHGVTMHEAIMEHITTRYVLLMDSDVIIERGGFLEQMLSKISIGAMSGETVYAIGSLMCTSRSNFANGLPINNEDVLPYAHPSFSIYDREKYIELSQKKVALRNGFMHDAIFCNDGSPCCLTAIAAQDSGYYVIGYAVDKYVKHLSGSSWTSPRTIWRHDFDVPKRPFLTFIVPQGFDTNQLARQTDQDFEIVFEHEPHTFDVFIHGHQPVSNTNTIYKHRLNVNGMYVYRVEPNQLLPDFFVDLLKKDEEALKSFAHERKYWQEHLSLL